MRTRVQKDVHATLSKKQKTMIEHSSYNNILFLIFKCVFYLQMHKYICFGSIKMKSAVFSVQGFST